MRTFTCLNEDCSHQEKHKRGNVGYLRCERCGWVMIPEVERRNNKNYKKDIHESYASGGNVYICEQCYRRSYVDKNLTVVTCPGCCAGRAVPMAQLESVQKKSESTQKKFVCPNCEFEKLKDENIVTTHCNECGNAMLHEDEFEKLQQPSDSGTSTEKNGEKTESTQKKFVCSNCGFEKLKDEDITRTHCNECGSVMLEESELEKIQRSRGGGISLEHSEEKYVYVLVSSEKPNLVKIGMTERTPEERARELSQTSGVAMPYIVAYEAKTSRPKEVERAVHRRLSDKRVNPNREFFRVKPKRAIEAIEQEI